MRAARFVGGRRIELQELPVPEPGAGEVLVKVDSCALCGTDRRSYETGTAVVPGHEVSGTIAALGQGATHALDARGVVYLVGYCGSCYACRSGATNICLDKQKMYGFDTDGGYAEYVKVRAECFLPVSPDVPLDLATSLLDLYGTSGHAFRRAGLRHGDTVAVMGCGPIGLGAISMAGALGAGEVCATDLAPDRLALADSLGATALDAAGGDAVAAALALHPDGFDVVIEAAGTTATQAGAVALTAPGGTTAFVAHNQQPLLVDTLSELIQREKTLLGSEYFAVSEFGVNHALLVSGRLDPAPLITHRFPLESIQEAFDLFMAGRGGKVLVQPAG